MNTLFAVLVIVSPPDPVFPSKVQHDLYRWVNAYRKRNGLQTCKPDPYLMKSAQFHAKFQRNYLGHNHGGTWMENVAVGYTTIRGVMHGWHGSYGHRINMLNPKHRYMGCGRYGNYWCLRFSTKPITYKQFKAARYVIPAWSTYNYEQHRRFGRLRHRIDWQRLLRVNGENCYRVIPLR